MSNYQKKFIDYDYGSFISKKFKKVLSNLFSLSLSYETNIVKDYITTLSEYYPQKLYRLKGIADNLGIKINKLINLAIFIRYLIRGGCTTSCVLSDATADNKIYLSWNLDIVRFLKPILYSLLFFVEDIPKCNKYIAWGIPGISGYGLLNDKGVGCVSSSVGLKDGGGKDGLFDAELNNLVMEKCSSIEEVVELFKTTPKYSFPGYTAGILLNLNFIFADNKNNGVLIEHSKNYIKFTYAKENNGVLAEANHHQFLDKNLSGSPTPNDQKAITGSYCRVGRMWELLKENIGKIDFNLMCKITSDHKLDTKYLQGYNYENPVDDATICCHYWNIPNYLKQTKFKKAIDAYFMGETIMSFIINLSDYIIYVCYGKPCKNTYIPIYCKQLLGLGEGSDKKISTSKMLTYQIKNSTKINQFFKKKFYFIIKLSDKIFNLFIRKLIILLFTVLEKIIKVN